MENPIYLDAERKIPIARRIIERPRMKRVPAESEAVAELKNEVARWHGLYTDEHIKMRCLKDEYGSVVAILEADTVWGHLLAAARLAWRRSWFVTLVVAGGLFALLAVGGGLTR